MVIEGLEEDLKGILIVIYREINLIDKVSWVNIWFVVFVFICFCFRRF